MEKQPLESNVASLLLIGPFIFFCFVQNTVYTRCVRKETGLVSQKLYFNLKSNITRFPFKVVSHKPNTLFHSFLPCIYGLLEGFFWNLLQFYGHGPFDCFYVLNGFV